MILVQHFRELDRLLRGRVAVRSGGPITSDEPAIDVSAARLTVLIVLLGVTYGLCMGSFAVVAGRAGTWKQMLSSAVKVPALFLLTLAVTFPSLYVFGALADSNLTARTTWRVVIAALAVMLAVLASFGTIVAFFSFTTESHAFMALLNVAVFALAGLFGMSFLVRKFRSLEVHSPEAIDVETKEPVAAPVRSTRRILLAWIVLFALVGAQMSWILRPFIGGQAQFALFRERGSNFFEAVYHLALKLLGNG